MIGTDALLEKKGITLLFKRKKWDIDHCQPKNMAHFFSKAIFTLVNFIHQFLSDDFLQLSKQTQNFRNLKKIC